MKGNVVVRHQNPKVFIAENYATKTIDMFTVSHFECSKKKVVYFIVVIYVKQHVSVSIKKISNQTPFKNLYFLHNTVRTARAPSIVQGVQKYIYIYMYRNKRVSQQGK